MFVPVIGVLYLDVYETRLLQEQERQMVQQGRMLAAAAGGRELVAADVQAILTRLERQTEARFRVYDANGTLIADSAALASTDSPRPDYSQDSSDMGSDIRDRVLYRFGAWLVGVRQRIGGFARRLLQPTRCGLMRQHPEVVYYPKSGQRSMAAMEPPHVRPMASGR